MAQAKVEIIVQDQQVDKLRGKLVELQRGLKIQYDIDGKPIDIVIDKSLNLQKQLRLLTAELRKTSEGSAEFQLLSSKIGDTEDALARSNAKSRDFLASLQLIPGPVGQIASQLNGAIGALKLFSGFSFKDLRFQLKELNDDLNGIFQNIFGIKGAAAEATAELGDTASTLANTGAEQANTAATLENVAAQQASTVAKSEDTAVTNLNTNALLANIQSKQASVAASELELTAAMANLEAIEANTAATVEQRIAAQQAVEAALMKAEAELADASATADATFAEIANSEATLRNTVVTQEQTTAQVANATATEAASTATKGFGATLKAVLSSTLFWVVAIGAVVVALYKWLKASAELSREQQALNDLNAKVVENYGEQIVRLETLNRRIKEGGLNQRQKTQIVNEYNKTLGDTLGKVKSYDELEKKLIANGPLYVKYLELKARAESAYQLSVERGKKLLESELKNSVEYANAFDIWKEGGFLGFIYDTSNKAGQKKKEQFLSGLKQDQNQFLDIFKTTQSEADQLAEQLKIPQPTITDMGGGAKEDPRIQATKDLYQKLKDIREENEDQLTKTSIDKEREREFELLKIAKEREENEIKALKLTDVRIDDVLVKGEDLRQQMLAEIKEKYALKVIENNKKYQEEDLKSLEDFQDKRLQILNAAIEDETQRKQAERERNKNNELKELENDKEFIKLSEEEKAKLRQAIRRKYEIEDERDKEEARKKAIDDRIQEIDDELEFFENRQSAIREGTKAFFDSQREILQLAEQREIEELNKQILTKEEFEKRKTAIEEKYVKLRKDLKQQETFATLQAVAAGIDALANLSSALASSLDNEAKTSEAAFKKRKSLQIATAVMSAASGIIQILAQPSTIPSPFDWIVKGINAAALAVTSGVQIANIKRTQFEGGGGGVAGTVRGMARGGLVEGPGTATSDSVPTMLSNGEGVMTAGAVTMFEPLLSMMNQMGGGVPFRSNLNTTYNDKPNVERPDVEPVIIKSYVVESELTTTQQKQARLKQLSTL